MHLRPAHTGTFCRARTKKEEPSEFLKGHEGQAATARKAVARPVDQGPKKAGAWSQRPNPPNSEFRRFYERSDLPIVMSHSSRKSALHWKVGAQLSLLTTVSFMID